MGCFLPNLDRVLVEYKMSEQKGRCEERDMVAVKAQLTIAFLVVMLGAISLYIF